MKLYAYFLPEVPARSECRTLQDVQDILWRLKEVQADIPVIIEPAANVPMEHVINLYDICR
ncbi:MAG: hypothetical protein LBT46_01825 [Planctomycetaceae bacterium]|jgi:hypothetical protein|nr:hypothetical protein [Planctomycetaceae bacterium]